jgi:hypothetical protein
MLSTPRRISTPSATSFRILGLLTGRPVRELYGRSFIPATYNLALSRAMLATGVTGKWFIKPGLVGGLVGVVWLDGEGLIGGLVGAVWLDGAGLCGPRPGLDELPGSGDVKTNWLSVEGLVWDISVSSIPSSMKRSLGLEGLNESATLPVAELTVSHKVLATPDALS